MNNSQISVSTPVSSMEIINELKSFINNLSNGSKDSVELTRSALFLIRHLPASRIVTLEYLKTVFKSFTKNYIDFIEKDSKSKVPSPNEQENALILEIYNDLHGFIILKSSSWSTIISTWCLELLGEISTEFADHKSVKQGLNETLQLWMNCNATKTLVDLTTQCLTGLMYSNSEACISSLLDTSIKHSPHFDWVVAHVGSCFPKLVIQRVLDCGLKDFSQNKSYLQGLDAPKLKSVVGILGHLVISHTTDIQKAIIDLFEASMVRSSNYTDSQKITLDKATVPFLLHLFNLSEMLLNSVSDEIKHYLNLNIILNLYAMFEEWSKYFGSAETFKDLSVGLIMKCSKGGLQVIHLLLDCTICDVDGPKRQKYQKKELETVRNCAQELLECVLNHLENAVRDSHNDVLNVPLLNSLIYDIDDLQLLLLSDKVKAQVAARILIYIGQINQAVFIRAVSHLLQHADQIEHLAYLIRIINGVSVHGNSRCGDMNRVLFHSVLKQIFNQYFIHSKHYRDDCGNDFAQLWSNILVLLRWEKSEKVFMLKNKFISESLERNMAELMDVFKGDLLNVTCHTFTDILDLLGIPICYSNHQMSLQQLINFVNGTVDYFFMCCLEQQDEILRHQSFTKVERILKRLCVYSKIARNLAIKQLLEYSLFSKHAELFGVLKVDAFGDASMADMHKSLLMQNKKISKTIHVTKHSSVFNGGIIGFGRRKSARPENPRIDFTSANREHLINALKACCSSTMDEAKFSNASLESLTLVSLILVQIVSPDVMYNGLPWPEEDFSKVTIERDLQIRRLFNATPLLWDLMNFIALHRPSLCYCSVLIRALTATLIHQWASTGSQNRSVSDDGYELLTKTTIQLIDLMALGQILPSPLIHIRDVIPFLNANEIVSILKECVWCYMRDNIPSPALFLMDSNGLHWRDSNAFRPADAYTKTLRIIMQRNIKKIGPLYAQMFRPL